MKKITKPKVEKDKKQKLSRDTDCKSTPHLEEFEDLYNGNKRLMTQAFLERLGNELIQYVKTSDMLRIEMFFIEKGIPSNTARKWEYKYPAFQEKCNEAKVILGMRREAGAMLRKYDSSIVSHTQIYYDSTWREAAQMKAKMQSESEGKGQQTINVIMQPIEPSDMVPEMKKKI